MVLENTQINAGSVLNLAKRANHNSHTKFGLCPQGQLLAVQMKTEGFFRLRESRGQGRSRSMLLESNMRRLSMSASVANNVD